MPEKYPLQITISTLFIILVVTLVGILSWQSFNKTSAIILDEANALNKATAQKLMLDFKASYGAIAGSLRQFRYSPLIKADNYTKRIAYLPVMYALLESDPSVFAVNIAYANGDYLGIRLVHSARMQKKYAPPAAASIMVLYRKASQQDAKFKAGRMYKIFYDKNLKEISRSAGKKSNFNPHNRPWYIHARNIPSATRPYIFYDSGKVGLTAMVKAPVAGTVVAMDITLAQLSRTIAKYHITPHSEVVLINAHSQIYAYRDQQKIIVADTGKDTLHLARLNQLGSGVLSYVSRFIQAKPQMLNFEYHHQHWIGSTTIVARPGGTDLYVLMLSPVDELLADAIAIRWQQIVIAMLVLLIFIPIVWYVSKKISSPLNKLSREAVSISRFDFSSINRESYFIKEVDQLDSAMALMKSTINKFISLINLLAGERNLETLLENITSETMLISQSDSALIYLMDEQDDRFKARYLCRKNKDSVTTDTLPALTQDEIMLLLGKDKHSKSHVLQLTRTSENKLSSLLDILEVESVLCVLLPLENRNNEIIGLLCLIYQHADSIEHNSNIDFIEALSGFAAVTLESRQLFKMQEALLQSFIKLIAGAIDAKSPYTGGHCQRVPEITLMLAEAACRSEEGIFSDFDLNKKQWEELNIAGWLHDCGKVTTPEYVVDKATKLETIYDRIHEIRMRFEVLKREAEIDCWQHIANGANRKEQLATLEKQWHQLDEEFTFVAQCNIGSEYMDDEKINRLNRLAEKTWLRTLDDNLGLSWEECNRKGTDKKILPVKEKLLSDRKEHLIERPERDRIPADNAWGFQLDTPKYKYNRGELYNLSVKRGTLNEEERYIINGHMIQTIIMLNSLPYPKDLRSIPLIAGSHHETMDGKGYPRRLHMGEQPLTARMMVIADIFEALTASDRPYKKAKTLSESIRILHFMCRDQHIDKDLFKLFLSSGVYLRYAKKFLRPEQIDEVNIEEYLSSPAQDSSEN